MDSLLIRLSLRSFQSSHVISDGEEKCLRDSSSVKYYILRVIKSGTDMTQLWTLLTFSDISRVSYEIMNFCCPKLITTSGFKLELAVIRRIIARNLSDNRSEHP